MRYGRLILALQAARGNTSKPQPPCVAVSFPLPCSVLAPGVAQTGGNAAAFRSRGAMIRQNFIYTIVPLIRFWLVWASLFIVFGHAVAQSDYVVIDSLTIIGNKRTKANIILREVNIHAGDTIPVNDLLDRIEWNRQRIIATRLFNRVDIVVLTWSLDQHLHVQIEVEETWYLWPVPIFEIADRNFNVWWYEMERDPRRTNYGLALYHANTTGRRDNLHFVFRYGFNRKYEIEYGRPYIDKRQKLGLRMGFYYARTNDVGYKVEDNRLVFYRDRELPQVESYRGHILLRYRPKILNRHEVGFRYFDIQVAGNVPYQLNPDFFLDGSRRMRYFSISYNYRTDHRDVQAYPQSGYLSEISLRKDGFGLPFENRNTLRLEQMVAFWQPLANRVVSDTRIFYMTHLQRGKQDFYNYRGLGYGNATMRGYETYVINGIDYVMAQQSFLYKFFDKTIDFSFMQLPKVGKVPIMVGLSGQFDGGFANDPFYSQDNDMTNRWLYSSGVGIDVVYFNRARLHGHLTLNHTGQHGFFLQLNAGL